MIRKFCRVFCVVFLIADFQSSFSHFDGGRSKLPAPKINNGSLATLGDARHQASIRLIEKEVTFGQGHICGGSLISSRVVLTAAQCFFDLDSKQMRHPAELYVVLGTLNRYQPTEHTVISRVTHIRYAETFNLTTMRDDIGLMFLSREIPSNHPTVRPIELNRKVVGVDIRGTVTGWGSTEKGHNLHQLLVTNVSTTDLIKCETKDRLLVKNSVICARSTRDYSDVCQVDVGAPLMHSIKQIGILSRSESCLAKDQQEVYTSVAYHQEWIWRELTDNGNADSSAWGLFGLLAFTWYAFKDQRKMDCRY